MAGQASRFSYWRAPRQASRAPRHWKKRRELRPRRANKGRCLHQEARFLDLPLVRGVLWLRARRERAAARQTQVLARASRFVLVSLLLLVTFTSSGGHRTGPSRQAAGELGPRGLQAPPNVPRVDRHSKLDPRLIALVEEFSRVVVSGEGQDAHTADELAAQRIAAKAQFFEGDKIAVAIHTSGSAGPVLEAVEKADGRIAYSGDEYLEAYVPLAFLPRLDDDPRVASVEMIAPGNPTLVGEGFTVHNVALWQSAGLTGAGVKVGIIDLGFVGFAALMGTELPTTVTARCYTAVGTFTSNVSDCADGGPHGTAVAESVYDIAPGVDLYIAEPGSPADTRATVEWMVAEGVQVINYSVNMGYEGPGNGTSPYVETSFLGSVDIAVAGGIVWVSAAGNDATVSWYGDYVDDDTDGFMEFAPGVELNPIDLTAFSSILVYSRWDGAWLGTTRDLTIHLIDTDGITPLSSSLMAQTGDATSAPFEALFASVAAAGTYFLAISNDDLSDAPAWVQFRFLQGPAPQYVESDRSIGVPAESSNPGMLAVGAVHYSDTPTIEYFSSRGPTVDGRIKPDVVAANRGDTVTLGSFAGTSQSAPYVAGIAALVRQRYPSFGPVETAQWIKDHALPRGTGTPNNDFGWGLAYLPEV